MSPSTGTTAETEPQQETRADAHGFGTQIILCLGPWYDEVQPDRLSAVLQVLRKALGTQAAQALVACPVSDPQATPWQNEGLRLQPYIPSSKLHDLAIQTASTFQSLNEVMREHSAACGLLLGPEAQTLEPAVIRGLIEAVLERDADLALARYSTSRNEALLNAAILYPVSRAVFGVKAHFPLALDLAVSSRMSDRLAYATQGKNSTTQTEALVWPAAEAAVAGFTVAEVEAGTRTLPQPAGTDLSSVLNTIASSLFLDVETKAAYWQRTRPAQPFLTVSAVQAEPVADEPVSSSEIAELIDSFLIGYGNLHEIWALVLPPQTLLGLKRLSKLPQEEFQFPDTLWVRIVYDFILAHRLRVINRGHLMGALRPLYLAWVASHILAAQSGAPESEEALVHAFEADKPYLVSRWRWPDRFNP